MNEVLRAARQTLDEAARARASQSLIEVKHLGSSGESDAGRHYQNYVGMISNRMLSLYDDCVLLLEMKKIPPACILSRCILETYAIGSFSEHEIVRAFNNGGLDKAGRLVIEYINSSRFKVEEQKRLKAGKFSTSDYHFTKQAKRRMQNEGAVSKHILNALRHLFDRERTMTGKKESRFELVYEGLSEWTHPSQTSLFHAFAENTWDVETSFGIISFWDGALASCSQAMHCIVGLPELRANMSFVADQLTEAGAQKG